MAVTARSKLDAQKLRADFPIFEQQFHGKPLAYLDSAASSQKPRQMLDAMRDFYETSYANVHRGVYQLAERATEGLETARDLGKHVKRRAVKVALTVDADDATLANIVEVLQPDILQLHGRETVARLRDIKQKFGLQVMKAVAVETAADLASLPGYAAAADRILFDAVAPRGATRPGGLGAVFDWHVLENLDLKLPFMVSGGLDAGNVAEAVRVTRAGGVDVSSGVERAPGIKDPEMIRTFIRAARATENDPALTVAGAR